MKIAIILGTRPEIIKMAPVIRALENKMPYFVIHTGQHYSRELTNIFFEQLNLPSPKYNLHVESSTTVRQTAEIMIHLEEVLNSDRPDMVLVEGDTNSVLASAITASKLGIKVGHIEAGLRSYDRTMPEEMNRILTDHCSDLLFAPTEQASQTLQREGILRDKIFLTGNTIVDAIYQNIGLTKYSNILDTLKLEKGKYFLVTVHRAENVDKAERFASIMGALHDVMQFNLPIIYPIHPHSAQRLKDYGITSNGVQFTQPVGYYDFLSLESNANMILTDSGGVQEEACVLGIPCVTLRDNTERPETIEVGANLLAGTKSEEIIYAIRQMFDKKDWDNPFGDGQSAEKIIDIIKAY